MVALLAAWGYGWRRLDQQYLVRGATGLCALVPYLAVGQLGFIRGPLNSLAPVYLPTLLLLLLNLNSAPKLSRAAVRRARPVLRHVLPAGGH
jgi:hypothetical protein